MTEHTSPKITRSGVSRLITVAASNVLAAALFFAGAGTLSLQRAWLYYGGLLAYLLVAMVVLLVRFPATIELINERGKMTKKDVKPWDKAFGIAYVALLVVQPVVAGLDAGRFRWSEPPAFLAAPALGVTLLAMLFVHWAMVVNRFAETGVRIQDDRDHEVVSAGPYRFVRHPFYVSVIVTQLFYPPAVGSLCAYLPALAIVALFVWRTAREDATLRAELPGYADYASRVRCRLLPGVW